MAARNSEGLVVQHDVSKEKPCFDFKMGRCARGAKCKFSHNPAAVGPAPPAAAEPEKGKRKKDAEADDNDYRLEGLPRYCRINTLKTSRSKIEKRLLETGHFFCPDPKHPAGRAYFRDQWLPDVLVFKPKGQSDISRIPMIASGELIVQQLASCFPALALAPPPGAHAIDTCAAPGNKTSHLAALMQNRGKVYAFEVNERRCGLLRDMMEAKGASIVVTKHASFLDASPDDPAYAHVTHVLLDPSCSSSGMSKTPEKDPERLQELADNQEELVLHAMRFPAVEAVCYSTCSIHEKENEEVVRRILNKQSAFGLDAALPFWPRRGHLLVEAGHAAADEPYDAEQARVIAKSVVRCSYPDDQTIGFFLARFVRKANVPPAVAAPALAPSTELLEKLDVLEKAREKRAKAAGKLAQKAQQQQREAEAAGGGNNAGVPAPAKREVPAWRLERDANKNKKQKRG